MISIEITSPITLRVTLDRPIDVEHLGERAELERNKKVVLQVLEAFNAGTPDRIDALIHPEVADASQKFMLDFGEVVQAELRGLGGVKRQIQILNRQFPDLRFTVESITAEGDQVVLRWKMEGTNTGPVFGREPTGKRISHHGTEYVRLKDGLIIEHSDSAAPLEFLDKLGLLDAEMMDFLNKTGVRNYGA